MNLERKFINFLWLFKVGDIFNQDEKKGKRVGIEIKFILLYGWVCYNIFFVILKCGL